ncbi:MAG: carbamoyltransferase HypF [Dehalococcoidia bacterium]
MKERRRILVEGIVQGVGFRPFVYGLALKHALGGFILNDTTGVIIEVEGEPSALESFLYALRTDAPPLATIEGISWESLPPKGDASFTIEKSQAEEDRRVLISPDTCTCDDCLRELFDPEDRRYRYPFINCTNCGPRFTIIKDVPYDRERTTMAVFPMCPDCHREYEDPLDRRFHAQPNACPSCGPQVTLLDREGREMASEDPISHAARLMREGAIVAVKGLGGYHLACDAFNNDVVGRLRRRKHREDKPFALMAPDIEAVKALCLVDEAEEALLLSRKRPIVLLRKRMPNPVAHEVAPGHRYLGFMLPYSPLHYLLLRDTGLVLVMTSGNVSDEPIAYKDDDASQRLSRIADYYLIHNREIHMRSDDSVTRVVNGREMLIRRSKGHVPSPITMLVAFAEPTLACGAQLKNTFCLGKERYAFVSHHIGDLENYETLLSFQEGIDHFKRLFDIDPKVVAYDLHPEYLCTKYALELEGITKVGVQHHHAHIASCMAEHGLSGPVIGVAFDGTGYGSDGTIWGGEFLVADYTHFVRAAHLQYAPLPGGEQAIRGPWRMAASWLYQVYGDDMEALEIDFIKRLKGRPWPLLKQMIQRSINSPPASSMGRLFDAVSSLVGVRDTINYEGQAAVELEMIAGDGCKDAYPFAIMDGQPMVLQSGDIIRGVVNDLLVAVKPSQVSAKFHNTVAVAIKEICAQIREQHGLNAVVLSGGVFQNMFLMERAVRELSSTGFEVYIPSKVPANDGGISLGQAAVANAQVMAGMMRGPVAIAREAR